MGKELELAIKIAGKVDKSLGAAVNSAQSQLNSISKFTNKAMTAATVAVVAAGGKLVKDSVETYKDYQSAISSAAATGGIERGTADYEALNKAAREAGRTTVKTAEESANALEYMMLAGWNVQDSTKALMPVLKLSAATGADLATTSDLVTDSMANMGLGINDLNRYLDISAAANNKTNQTATQLLEAYIGVGGTLKNLNAPVEESAAVLGVLANRGTKGAEAGTALSAILVNMQKRTGEASKAMAQLGVSMYDSNGDARSIIDVFQDISDKTSGMTEQQRNLMYQMIGGKSHVDSFSKIMAGFNDTTADGTKEIYSLIDAFNQSGGALDNLYAIKTDTLEGSFATLNSALDDMKISIGERIAPTMKNAVEGLIDKVPQIEDVIVSALEKIIPLVEKAIGFFVDNADKIISGAINFAKAFAAFKIGTGIVKGVNLFKDLYKIGAKVGGSKVLKGIAGTFTGIGSSAAGATGGVATLAGSLVKVAIPLAATAAIIGGGIYLYKQWDKATYHWADDLETQANKIRDTSSSLAEMNGYRKELQDLNLVIKNPNSSNEEIEHARTRINEIADLLKSDYNLTINTNDTNLDNTITKLERASALTASSLRADLSNEITGYFKTMDDVAESYKNAQKDLPNKSKQVEQLASESEQYSLYFSEANLNKNNVEGIKELVRQMNEDGIFTLTNASYLDPTTGNRMFEEFADGITPEDINNGNMSQFLDALNDQVSQIDWSLGEANKTLTSYNDNIKKYDDAATKAAESLADVMISDIKLGDTSNVEKDINNFEQLGKRLVLAGADTSKAAESFAAAKEGYASFSAAIDDPEALVKMSQNLISYANNIDDFGDKTAVQAALLANGFINAEQAVTRGGDAIQNTLEDIRNIGSANGLFDGLDNNQLADKLTDIAHQFDLIPRNKSVAIDVEGNMSVVQEAENTIDSIRSVGNVDVSVNANGDIAILNETSGKITQIEGVGAVSLQVNAEGNIDVLDEAQNRITTIDSKTATYDIIGKLSGGGEIDKAVDYQSKLADVNVAQTVIGTFDGEDKISTAIKYQGQLEDKNVTYTVTFKQNGTPPANNATGTNNWHGGLTYVNDQRVADPREVIETGGMRYWYEGKNVLADIPKGARIYTAAQSRAFINGSHRNGLERVPFDGYIAELHQGERVLTSEEASEYGDYRLGDYLDMLLELMDDNPRTSGGGDDNSSQRIVFSPNITIYGDADEERVMSAMRISQREFEERFDEMCRDRRRKAFY